MAPSADYTAKRISPYEVYLDKIDQGSLRQDSNQHLAILRLQELYEDIEAQRAHTPRHWIRRLLSRTSAPVTPKGIYIYGGVGRGKSMLMDIFYKSLSHTHKKRVHFHSFMQNIHTNLHTARQAGLDNPLSQVLDDITNTGELRVLCLDEMQVTDITDAMLIGRVFQGLYTRHVVIIATSNRPPEDLYKDGLNRHLFLPFINLIKEKMDIHRLDGPLDYRSRHKDNLQVYLTPLSEKTRLHIDNLWQEITGQSNGIKRTIVVQNRKIILPCCHEDCLRTSFNTLCNQPYGAADYLALTNIFRTIIIEDIPYLTRESANAAKRFVTLVDTIYENRRVLICSAACQPENLYESGTGAFEFQRTASRLQEMRSAQYLRNSRIF